MTDNEKQNYLAYFNGRRGSERDPSNYQRRDDASHIYENDEEYYEWWYFDAYFDNGFHIVITYYYRNMFIRPAIPSCHFFLYKPDGTKIEKFSIHDHKDISASPDFCHVKMGDNFVKDMDDHYDLYINIENFGARLKLVNSVPPWKLGTGYNYFDRGTGKAGGWIIPMPSADVTGDLILNGEPVQVRGTAYHDHNWGNFYCYRKFKLWYWGRIHSEKYAIDYASITPLEKDAPQITPLLIAGKDGIILSTDSVEFNSGGFDTEKDFGQQYAKNFSITADTSGVKLLLAIKTVRMIESRQLPKVCDDKHYYYRFLADYSMDIEVDGSKDRANGQLLFEFMLF